MVFGIWIPMGMEPGTVHRSIKTTNSVDRDVSVVGDWNGNGKTEIGVTNGINCYLDTNGNSVWDGTGIDKYRYLGTTGGTPVVGKWQRRILRIFFM
jgi:hypothetical protein